MIAANDSTLSISVDQGGSCPGTGRPASLRSPDFMVIDSSGLDTVSC